MTVVANASLLPNEPGKELVAEQVKPPSSSNVDDAGTCKTESKSEGLEATNPFRLFDDDTTDSDSDAPAIKDDSDDGKGVNIDYLIGTAFKKSTKTIAMGIEMSLSFGKVHEICCFNFLEVSSYQIYLNFI